MLGIFSWTLLFIYLLWCCVNPILLPILKNWIILLSSKSFLHILDTGPLSYGWFANIFFPNLWLAFSFRTLFYEESKCLILMKYNCSILFFIVLVLYVLSQKLLPSPGHKDFFLFSCSFKCYV